MILTWDTYLSEHFQLKECINNYDRQFMTPDIAYWQLNHNLFIPLEWLRKYFNKRITINSFYRSFEYQNELKLKGYKPGKFSQHMRGNAIDLVIYGLSAIEIRNKINDEWNKGNEAIKIITCMEIDIPWVHIDARPLWDKSQLLKVKP